MGVTWPGPGGPSALESRSGRVVDVVAGYSLSLWNARGGGDLAGDTASRFCVREVAVVTGDMLSTCSLSSK